MVPNKSSHAYVANPVYLALTTAHARHSVRNGVAIRYPAQMIPFAAVPEPGAEALADLVPLLTAGEEIYLTADAGQTIRISRQLEIISTLPGLQMIFEADALPGEVDYQVISLGRDEMEEMIDLKARAFPGFFGPRAWELGSFYGIRDGETGRLVAMGGERLATDKNREISAVCTDPDFAGRGYAAQIVRAVLSHQAGLGTTSILHVTAANHRAISLYERLGFRTTGCIDFVKVRRV